MREGERGREKGREGEGEGEGIHRVMLPSQAITNLLT